MDLEALKLQLTGIDREDPALPQRGEGYDYQTRAQGADWPATALTMIGLERLSNIEYCVKKILGDQVPGDLIETGVWRGGAAIFMRAMLQLYRSDRTVWVADSFAGMPGTEHGGEDGWFDMPELAIPLDEVKANFAAYGLLDDQVRFLPGWFDETLPAAPIGKLALLRLDGDLYSSTMTALEALYPKMSPGAFVIIDDWWFKSCRDAVTEYRAQHGITAPIWQSDYGYWRVP